MTHDAQYQREWRQKNPASVVASRARYRADPENRAQGRATSLAYYYAHKQDFIERQRKRRAENPEKYLDEIRRGNAARAKVPKYRVAASIRASLHKALRGERKSAPTFKMLGYTLQELMTHMEALFLPGMSWENYGQWHIDHRKPVSLFVLPDETLECFALSNLQPLWAFDNISKGGSNRAVANP